MATGKREYAEMALGLARSLALAGDDHPRYLLTDHREVNWARRFAGWAVPDPAHGQPMLQKFRALDYFDLDEVLFLDADSLAMKPMDDVFSLCAGADFAVQGIWLSEGSFRGRDLAQVCRELGVPAFPRFNGGFAYYRRGERFQTLLKAVDAVAQDYDRWGFDRFRGGASAEVCLSLAMLQTGIGTMLPTPFHVSHSGIGALRTPRVDVRTGECSMLVRGHTLRRIEPYVFHAHYYRRFRFYWRQLKILERLERYEDRTERGHKTKLIRLRKSIESRLLKLTGRIGR